MKKTYVVKVARSSAKMLNARDRIRSEFNVQLRLLELLLHKGERGFLISVREGDRVEGFRVIGYRPL